MEDLLTKDKADTKIPRNYNVVMLNDDFTPVDFVVEVLIRIFGKSTEEACALAFEVHKNGRGIAGTYPRDTAETMTMRAMNMAKAEEHPFMMQVQPS